MSKQKTTLTAPPLDHHLVILTEFGGDEYVTVVKDPTLIAWLDLEIDFGAATQLKLPVPGVPGYMANVSCGSPWNDKLIAITNDPMMPAHLADHRPADKIRDCFEKFAPERVIEGQIY